MINYTKKNLLLYLFFILVIFCSYSYQTITTYGANTETPESLNQKLSETQQEIAKLDAEIKKYQDQISQTSEQSQTLGNLIKELTLTRNKLLKETAQTQKKIQLTNQVIADLGNNIENKKEEINVTQSALKKSLYQMYQNDQISFVEIILAGDKISDISREYQNKIALNEKVTYFINTTERIKTDLEINREKKEIENANLNSLKEKLDQEKKAVDLAKAEKDKVLKATKNKESEYKKILAEQQRKRDAFEKEFRDYESQLKFLLNPSLLPTVGSGALSWPLEKVLVTQLFGRTSSSGRLYASGSHSGVDFRASIGTPVYAMGTGTVMGTGDTDKFCKGASFGKWVFIQYNNGLSSTYGHLSSIIAKVGDQVNSGTTVALSGNSGHSTGPHLHVTVYASQGAEITQFPSKSCPGANFTMPVAPIKAYLDPILYLPTLNKATMLKNNPKD